MSINNENMPQEAPPSSPPRKKSTSLKRRRQLKILRIKIVCAIALITIVLVSGINFFAGRAEDKKAAEAVKTSTKESTPKKETEKEEIARIRSEAIENNYPAGIINLLSKNPETKQFVEDYGEKKDSQPAEKIADSIEAGTIPSLIQWDERWGYSAYGTSTIAASGCGPTCMSMVVAGLTGDVTATPYVLAKYSEANSYIDESNNTYWIFMNEACDNWGISSYESGRDDVFIQQELEAGHPIICSVGPGDFTDSGHFIVLTSYNNGNVTLNDPFSIENSEKTWVYADIADQIKEIWSYSKIEE